MDDTKKNDLYALAVTIAVHAALLLVLLFCTLAAPVIPDNDGSGVVLQLGVIDADAGTFTPAPPPPAPVAPQPEETLTQDVEETVSLDDQTAQNEQLQSDTTARPTPEPETSQLDNLWANALSKGKSADDAAEVAGEQKGSPQGTAASSGAAGSPGYGDYDLGGRGLIGRLPKPEYGATNDEGTIVVSILVDAAGRVVQAVVTPSGSKGSAASNAALRSRAEEAARRAVFERKTSGSENQWGTITYYFRQK